ncbi:hypothetical protein DM02DRAFT_619713 [Periconia macrospinosa]|uniref:ISWI chromatin-remodeling complex ATPase ISW2 n=1 Tax=Periconia macrospinosa TaxID=97972 RepID=A0A2V1D444_9PLEO|nr:hypothetical protein DM02DRAFT_619713 [Periconia macrospinosa]
MAANTPTPTRRGGALDDLMLLFASQSSATSATKARRESSQMSKPATPESKLHVHALNQTQNSTPTSTPTPQRPRSIPAVALTASQTATQEISESSIDIASSSRTSSEDSAGISSEDDFVTASARPVRAAPRKELITELKMETRRRESPTEAPRRSLRNRKSDILASDTVQHPPPPSPSRRKTPLLPKLDTARTRLREEIAQKTKVKADNFLVANKDYFLPLLPERNYISRLVTKAKSTSTVPYQAIKQQPEGINATMKPYQLEGLSFLVHLYNNGLSGILGDEMGLGKTLQTLSLFQYLEELDRKNGVTSEELRPYLVICPLSVLDNWINEIRKFTPGLKVLRYHGNVKERERLKRIALGLEDRYGNETVRFKDRKASQNAGLEVSRLPTDSRSDSFKIVVTTYDSFQAEQSWFKHSFVWRYVVLDEGHKIKNQATQLSSSLRNISSEYRLILTGTPLQNNLVEMWALLAWLYPDVFPDNTQALFKESFDLTRGKVNRKTLDDARHLLELIMIRRMKDSPSVNLGLPPKEEILLYVPLTPMQRFWYTRLLTKVDDGMLIDLFADGKSKEVAALEKDRKDQQLVAEMEKLEATATAENRDKWEEAARIAREAIEKEQEDAGNSNLWRKLMNLVMQLRKCCSHPYLLPGALPDPYHVGQHLIRASGKFILLEKLLKNSILHQGKKVLIFSGFTQTLDCCEDLLALVSNFGQDFKFLRLDGSTQRAQRNLQIRLFNDPKSPYKVMLLSTRAGGLGINLTAAEDVVFLDEDWNPQITLQAEARAHRIGQTKKVTIYKICTQGTVEEQMMGRIRKKLYLSAKITESMRNIHGEDVATAGPSVSVTDDAPTISTTQLKTLVRRGAQTLSHPEIDVNDMISWDLATMMQHCTDQGAGSPVADTADAEPDEEKWLSVMERVECAVFDGKRYHRNKESKDTAASILPDSVSRQDRRRGKNVTVMIDGYAVNKESLNCADWEAVPTFAGKDPRIAEPEREKRREYQHEGHCLMCFDDASTDHIVECKGCPRAYHFNCLDEAYQAKVKGFSHFYCLQHLCADCGKSTVDAGGLIYRCRWCPRALCEDCLAMSETKEELVGENLPEFEMLGEHAPAGGFYIKCPECIEDSRENKEREVWMNGMEASYQKQHEQWLKVKEEEQRHIEVEDAALEANNNKFASKAQTDVISTGHRLKNQIMLLNQEYNYSADAAASPPSLTETESTFLTSAPGGSGINTPASSDMYRGVQGRKRSELDAEADFGLLHPPAKKGKYISLTWRD